MCTLYRTISFCTHLLFVVAAAISEDGSHTSLGPSVPRVQKTTVFVRKICAVSSIVMI